MREQIGRRVRTSSEVPSPWNTEIRAKELLAVPSRERFMRRGREAADQTKTPCSSPRLKGRTIPWQTTATPGPRSTTRQFGRPTSLMLATRRWGAFGLQTWPIIGKYRSKNRARRSPRSSASSRPSRRPWTACSTLTGSPWRLGSRP